MAIYNRKEGLKLHQMRVMGRKGDTRVEWDPKVPAEVEQARKTFEAYKDKGFAVFAVTRHGDKGKQVRDFNPDAEEILFVPPIAGG